MEISTYLTTFCTPCSYWKRSEADRQLLSWKRNLEAGLMRKMTWSVHYALSLEYWFFPYIFLPTFPLGRVEEAAALWGLEIPHEQQQSQIVLLAQHQDGTQQSRRCNHSTWSNIIKVLVQLLQKKKRHQPFSQLTAGFHQGKWRLEQGSIEIH